MKNRNWTEDELICVLRLYCLIDFGKIDRKNPQIIELSKLINRTPSAVALKMANFANLDPTIDRKGMGNVSILDKITWNKFFNNMNFYIEREENSICGFSDQAQTDYIYDTNVVAFDVMRNTKTRVGQDYFRKMIVASYEGKCALSSIDSKSILIASHIIPWSVDEKLRLNPHNGLCLNPLLDTAFENGIITIDSTYHVHIAQDFPRGTISCIKSICSSKLRLPSKFLPSIEFLEVHRSKFSYTYIPLST